MSDTALLILSTVPHLFVIPCVASPTYGGIVLWSSLLSILWHANGSNPYTILSALDHALAAAWFVADCYYFWDSHWLGRVVGLNLVVAAANIGVDFLPYPYALAHSVWHLISAAKALYVASLISRVARLSAS